jgi:hypothetical protein
MKIHNYKIYYPISHVPLNDNQNYLYYMDQNEPIHAKKMIDSTSSPNMVKPSMCGLENPWNMQVTSL